MDESVREHPAMHGSNQTAGIIYDLVQKSVMALLMTLVLAMAAVLAYQVVSRYVFDAPSALSQGFLTYSLIWLGMLGTGYCFMARLHLNLPLIPDMVSREHSIQLEFLNLMLTLGFGGLILYGGFQAVQSNQSIGVPILRVSVGTMQISVVIAGGLIVLSQIVGLVSLLRQPTLRPVLLLAPLVLLISLAFAYWVFAHSALYETLTFDYLEISSVTLLFGSFFVMLFMGTPIAVALALSGILTLSLQIPPQSLFATSGERLFGTLNNFGFLALPFFVLAGNIMNQGGIARRLIDLALAIGRNIPGPLWQANVMANMLFGCLSGSGLAAATAIGSIIAPIAREQDYDRPMTTAVNAASAPSGLLIPPSGPLILYSLITGGSASIVSLFLAGYIPGLIMGVSVMLVAYLFARKRRYPVAEGRRSKSELSRALIGALPSLSLVVVVIGGILGGVFSAVEGSGIAVIYSLLLGLVYRSLSWKQLMQSTRDTVITAGVIMFLIACSGLMSWSMAFASIPDTIGELLTSLSDNKYVLLLLINVMLLIVGIFMDMTPAMLIFTPIFYPVMIKLGVDPVHFGIILVYNLSVGLVTPPVGTILFVSCSITGESIVKVLNPLLPMFALQLLGLLVVTYIPAVSLWLPHLLN